MSLKRNVVANYLGQAWRALMGLAFVPLYIRYLGIEAYGLIGVFAILQAWLALLDMGVRPALGREMGRFSAGAHDAQSIRDLLRSVEILGLAVAAAIGIAIWAASGWLATEWVIAKTLPVSVVAQAFAVMGLVTALRLIESIYVTSIAGLQRQVLENVVSGIMATVRGVGAVGVLALISPSLEAFFLWQAVVSMMAAGVFAVALYRALPSPACPARFSWPALIGIWRFAAGMIAINFLALLLTQLDKMMLSRLLPLESFGYYVLAGMVVGALSMLASPITTAFFPRFTELATRTDELALRAAYHQAAQSVTVLMGAAAVVLIFFGDRLLLLWTADSALVKEVAPLLAVLALGSLLNGLIWVPYQMQLAHGWTALTMRINAIAVVMLVPALLWVVPKYGAIGAAWIWVSLNAGGLIFSGHLMFRRLLPTEKRRWYSRDLTFPLAAAAASAWLCRQAIPHDLGRLAELGALFISSGLVVIAAALAAPLVRSHLFALARGAPGDLPKDRRKDA